MAEAKIEFEYQVERKSARSKFYVVRKYAVVGGIGHYRETVSRDLSADAAYSFCARQNEEEKERRKRYPLEKS